MRNHTAALSLCMLFGCSAPAQKTAVDAGVGVADDLARADASPSPVSVGAVDLALSIGASPDLADPAGPWPLTDVTLYGDTDGLKEAIVDASPDEAQNLWAVSSSALYLRRPGEVSFHRYTEADGLHIGPFINPDGAVQLTQLTAMAGGGPNVVFVGYQGYETYGNPYLDTEAQKELGQADKVVVGLDGSLAVTRYLFRCDYEFWNGCWEDRSPRRMLFAHSGAAAGHLFIGFNHGVAHVYNDTFGDHVHPEVTYHYPNGGTVLKIGEFYGLAVTDAGDLWMAGGYGVGLQPWNPQPHFAWVDGKFIEAFTTYTDDHALDVPAGYREDQRGAAVTPDGTLWLGSKTWGLSSWPAGSTSYGTLRRWPNIPIGLIDLAADPDGTLWLVDVSGRLLHFFPDTGMWNPWAEIRGARRVTVDQTVSPRAVYVSMNGGLAVIRAK